MLHLRMFFGGSFRCSPISADSCPPDVSACSGMVGSHSHSPKLSALFRSENQRALEFQLSDSGDKSAFCAKPRTISTSTKRARNSRRICTSIFIGLKADQNQHLQKTPIRPGSAFRSEEPERGNSPKFFRFCNGDLQAGVSAFWGARLLRFVQQVGIRSARRRLIMPQPLRCKSSRMNTCTKMVGGWVA